MKRFLLTLMLVLLALPATALKANGSPIQDWQIKIGTDKLAHFFVGTTCGYLLIDRVFTKDTEKFSFRSKKYRKAKSLFVCSSIAALKEISDVKADWKDFEWTVVGASIPLITWRF